MADLYRKTALERISSPEQLDKVLEVSSPMSWPILIGIAVLLAVILFVWPIPVRKSISVAGRVSPDGRQIECYLSGNDYEEIRKAREISVVLPRDAGGEEIRCVADVRETGTRRDETTAKVILIVSEDGMRPDPEISGGPFRFTVITGETSYRLVSFLFG